MEMLISNQYIMDNPDKNVLKSKGFRYNMELSDSEGDFYSTTFPVLQYNDKATVNGRIDVDMNSGEVFLSAYDTKSNISYAPFYKTECPEVYEPIFEKINNAFNEKFKKFSIKKAKKSKKKNKEKQK